ncbi:receptor-type adenylate cyclase, partial [Trypanosoma conorhini]
EDAEEYVPPTARLDAAVYRQHWNGLRVRVGVHTGLCDIRRDEATKGYDYYGDTANMAARTGAVGNGGQALLTRAAYMSLSTNEREQLEVSALGAVALRGVPRPVEMCQLDAVPGPHLRRAASRPFGAVARRRRRGLRVHHVERRRGRRASRGRPVPPRRRRRAGGAAKKKAAGRGSHSFSWPFSDLFFCGGRVAPTASPSRRRRPEIPARGLESLGTRRYGEAGGKKKRN